MFYCEKCHKPMNYNKCFCTYVKALAKSEAELLKEVDEDDLREM